MQQLDAKAFADAVRSHWTIKNSPRQQADATFVGNQCRVRTGLADAAPSLGRRETLGLLRHETFEKIAANRVCRLCNFIN